MLNLQNLLPVLPVVAGFIAYALLITLLHRLLARRISFFKRHPFGLFILTLTFLFMGLSTALLFMPPTIIPESFKGQLLGLFGVVFSAAVAISSTTFIGNAMAGAMLRSVNNFRIGDVVQVADYMGRITERGLFHVELQTEDRDLMTLPNMYLINHPVKVMTSSGTIISAEVSLGYDVYRKDVEAALLEAISATGLEDGFVHIVALGDFSINYRAAGVLADPKSSFLSKRSQLRANILDALHNNTIEIVSPTFMNTKPLEKDAVQIPKVNAKHYGFGIGAAPEKSPEVVEDVIFDKAERVETQQKMVEGLEEKKESLKAVQNQLQSAEEAAIRDELLSQEELLTKEIQSLEVTVEDIEEAVES